MEKNKKNIPITGGTKGTGKAIAVCLAHAGYDLILTYATDSVRATTAEEEMETSCGVHVYTLQADLSEKASIDKTVDFLHKKSRLIENSYTKWRNHCYRRRLFV